MGRKFDLPEILLNPEAIHYLVVHCSDTPDDDHLDATDIHKMHLGFGWDGIGYHAVVTRNGTIERGRPEYWVGAHVYGHNSESLGVCLIGRSDFTPAQIDSLILILREWKSRYPQAEIRGHCDFDNTEKTCPNFDVHSWAQQMGLA
jgi:N-acetylmuramoyl-L-alanine amidase